jgi:hypothetical protein
MNLFFNQNEVMDFFKRKTTWTNGEFVVIKTCLASLGIFIGVWLYEWLANYKHFFLAVYLVTAIITLYLWIYRARTER